MDVKIVFGQMVIMFTLMGLGFGLARVKLFSDKAPSDFSKMIVEVCNPALIICSTLNRESTASRNDILLAVLLAVIYYAALIGLSLLIPRLIRAKKSQVTSYQLLSVYGNIGFMGIPLITAVMGNSAVIYLSLFIIIFNLLIYTHGIGILTGKSNSEKGQFEWRRMINSGTIASVIALVIYVADISVPAMANQTLQYVGQCTTFFAMAIIGMALANISAKELFSDGKLYIFIALRFLLLPVVVALCLKPILNNQMLLGVIVLTLALPAGNTSLMLSEQYNGETDLLARAIILTTILSVITVTVASWVLAL